MIDYLEQLIERYPKLCENKNEIKTAYDILVNAFKSNHKLLVAGNGGSAADADHIVGELMKSFLKKRALEQTFIDALDKIDTNNSLNTDTNSDTNIDAIKFIKNNIQGALPAIALTNHSALSTATLNDIDGKIIFSQQVYGYGKEGDVFLGISTSGNAKNIYYAALTAKARGLKTIALSGRDGGLLAKTCDVSIVVRENETYKIQELHLPVYHTLCLMLEEHFF
jgi:D-sedoheptulose 7-phosphate isomerase